MNKKWLKELARDFAAFGSIPFLALTIVRVSVMQIYYPMQFIISSAIFFILRAFFKAELRAGIGFILLVFTALFYRNMLFGIFALLTYAGIIGSLFYLGHSKKEIAKGIACGFASALAGYVIVSSFFFNNYFLEKNLTSTQHNKEGVDMPQTKTQQISLPGLPYQQDALEPVISARTISFHYGKHHQGYVDKLNTLIAGTEFETMKPEDIIAETAGKPDKAGIFNNAAQVWNHTFYWNCLRPEGGGKPSGKIGKMIEESFGGYDNFAKKFAEEGAAQFGSGWVWLVQDNGKLDILKTANAENPLSLKKGKAILVLDVWEHAYYLDYQNKRADHLKEVIEKLLNWDFAEKNL